LICDLPITAQLFSIVMPWYQTAEQLYTYKLGGHWAETCPLCRIAHPLSWNGWTTEIWWQCHPVLLAHVQWPPFLELCCLYSDSDILKWLL